MEIIQGKKTALVLGASGLVGSFLVPALLAHPAYAKVRLLLRKKLPLSDPKLEQVLVDFDRLDSYEAYFKADDLFVTLGTTMAKAGSRDAFYKVDYTYTVESCQVGLRAGVNQLMLVTAVGADVDSRFYYNRVKGQVEEAVKAMPFWALHIFRPSILLGSRNENRFGEKIAMVIGKGIDRISGGLLSRYKPVEAEVVARAMVSAAQQLQAGIHEYPSHYLQRLSESLGDQLSTKPRDIH